jgi:hypothetical protein
MLWGICEKCGKNTHTPTNNFKITCSHCEQIITNPAAVEQLKADYARLVGHEVGKAPGDSPQVPTKTVECLCGRELPIRRVQSDNGNYGRPYTNCKHCDKFRWVRESAA